MSPSNSRLNGTSQVRGNTDSRYSFFGTLNMKSRVLRFKISHLAVRDGISYASLAL